MRLASLLFASLLVLVLGVATFAFGSMAVAQTRSGPLQMSHALDGQVDHSQQADTSGDS